MLAVEKGIEEESRRNEGIKRLGTFMLSGWVLTDVPCIKCNIPTVRKKDKSIERFCVLCDHESDPFPPIEENQFKPVESVKEILNENEPSELNEAEMMEGFESKIDLPQESISSLLGKKMLQGWTMLQDCCPHEETCNGVPLMRNKNMELFCVCCDSYIPDPTKVIHPDVKKKPENISTVNSVINNSTTISTVKIAKDNASKSAKMALEEKITELAVLLKGQSHPADILQTCQAIEAAAKALQSLDNLSS